MTKKEAIKFVRENWDAADGCRTCGRHPALYEVEPIEVDDEDLENGYVDFPCSGDDGTEVHRGIRIYFPVPVLASLTPL